MNSKVSNNITTNISNNSKRPHVFCKCSILYYIIVHGTKSMVPWLFIYISPLKYICRCNQRITYIINELYTVNSIALFSSLQLLLMKNVCLKQSSMQHGKSTILQHSSFLFCCGRGLSSILLNINI